MHYIPKDYFDFVDRIARQTPEKSRGNVFEYFTAQWVNRNGKPCKKNFNILKYGVVKAHHLALKCRALNHHPNS